MTKEKTAPTRERPQAGGSYVRQKSGKLKQTEGTKPAETGAAGAPIEETPPTPPTDTPPAGGQQQEG